MKTFLRKAAYRLLNIGCAAAVIASVALFGPLPAMAFDLAVNGSTATGLANASTCANSFCVVTTESVTTAAAATYTETVTATPVVATDICMASVTTAGTGSPTVTKVTPAAGSLVIIIQNISAATAFNNTLVISYACFKS